MKRFSLLLAIIASLACPGCSSVVQRAGISLFYRPAKLPNDQIVFDVPYQEKSPGPEHRLNLFLPNGSGWPVFVFVHGGGWTEGNKDLRAGGVDVYGNIGRFYAAHGIGVAIINYRLQPGANWRDQVEDVAQATAWVHANIEKYGGNPNRLFIGGHSAGAQLASRVAVDPAVLKQVGLSQKDLSGVLSVSGAGLDLEDDQTYQLGASRKYYLDRFGRSFREASPVPFVKPGCPPFLVLYAGGETKALQRQALRLAEVLTANNVEHQLVRVPGQSHVRMVLALSRADKTAGPAILRFIQTER